MIDYSTWPDPFSAEWKAFPLHKKSSWDFAVYACEERTSLGNTMFDPRCDDCMSAAVGFLDAGQDIPFGRGFTLDGTTFQTSLQEFVEWINYYKRLKV